MTAEVIPFKQSCETKEDAGGLSGAARCLACKHEWTAVVPLEGEFSGFLDALDCPSCGCHRGQFKWPFMGPPAEELWTCRCGGTLFLITRQGTRCTGCGNHQTFNG